MVPLGPSLSYFLPTSPSSSPPIHPNSPWGHPLKKQKVGYLQPWLPPGDNPSPTGDIQRCLKAFWVVAPGEAMGERQGCCETSSVNRAAHPSLTHIHTQQRTTQAKVSVVLRLKNLHLQEGTTDCGLRPEASYTDTAWEQQALCSNLGLQSNAPAVYYSPWTSSAKSFLKFQVAQ